MGKSVTLGWLCPRTVTLVTEPPFCDMSYMSLPIVTRSEEHTSELQSLMRISYAVFCLKKKTTKSIQFTNFLQKRFETSLNGLIVVQIHTKFDIYHVVNDAWN